ncbi:hypothetical protein AUC31_11960 [Planococcus rifietoensis]|uniref:N-acetyltransferase domain-containing protein n=1 Tax=Planococcus rifietoensis TaxID=200991 RepID=A0A0U2QA21_9BACL|nr:GNAT family N-acetyltransferase [Planococcus rifietoensis]ALS75862.1 hypothetical protein AUC31_11960 [Planococcus rifietoensis]
MREIDSDKMHPSVNKLLSYATSAEKVEREYEKYMASPNLKLYGEAAADEFFACIGIALLEEGNCEIRHIAVLPEQREENIASGMIDAICRLYHPDQIFAETDRQTVGFYRNYGFSIASLGEKYPGVERFRCVYKVEF